MRRISAVFKGKGVASSSQPLPPSTRGHDAPIPPEDDSWVVDEAFLEESSRLVPASPDDVDDVTRTLFVTKVFNDAEWVDVDMVAYGLGVALDIFPDKSSFQSLKWVFVSNEFQMRVLN
jgi:hypothetical protein